MNSKGSYHTQLALLGTMMRDRDFYERTRKLIKTSKGDELVGGFYSKEFLELLKQVDNYYSKDGEAKTVQVPVLKDYIKTLYKSAPKTAEMFSGMLDEAMDYSAPSSSSNLEKLVYALKESELRYLIATKLVTSRRDESGSSDEEIVELIEQWKMLRAYGSVEAIVDGSILRSFDMVEQFDLESLVKKRNDPSNILPVYPKKISEVLDGGIRKGHHVVVFARPEAGKTAFAVNAASGLAYKGFSGIYFSNEDRLDDLILRFACNLTGMTSAQICADYKRAQDQLNRRLGDSKRIRIVSMAPGSIEAIDAYCEKYAPEWIVIDQIRNLADRKEDNRVLHLERVASKARNIAKARNAACFSITQAGDSASGKLFLDQGDVDFSNTGIPASADVMIGIGKKDDGDEEGLDPNIRGVHLCKNKITGRHEKIHVRIVPEFSRYLDV